MPIDIASGNVHVEYPEASVPGQVPLVWERRFSNALSTRTSGWWGPGWTSSFLSTLTRHPGGFEFVGPNGGVELLPEPAREVERGALVPYLHAGIDVFMRNGRYVVQRWDVVGGNVWRYLFDVLPDGQVMPLAAIENVAGQGLDMRRDANGRLFAIEQRSEHRALVLDYRPDGRLGAVALRSPQGRLSPISVYEYDPQGRLSAVTDALGFADRYTYDGAGRLSREVAKHGGVLSYRYDVSGRCIWQSGLDHYDEKRLKFLDATRITEMTDSRGCVHRYQWLPSGQIVSHWNPLGGQTRTEYDEWGRVVATIGPTGAATRYAYDENGNRHLIVNALGNEFRISFDRHHQPTAVTDPNGQTWQRKYDARDRLIGTVDPGGGRWTITYDGDGNPVAVTNPKGDVRRSTYEAGVQTQASDFLGRYTSYQFDEFGRLVARTDPLAQTWSYAYDAVGNLIEVAFPDGGKLHASYSPAGDIVRTVDSEGRVARYRYGPCRRLLGTVDANGVAVSYVWGSEPGYLQSVVNERGEHYSFVYDDAGRCVEETGFDGRRVRFEYDLAGQCTRTINGAGELVEHKRDLLGSIVEQVLPDGRNNRFTYDKSGRLSAAINADCEVRFERDAIGRLVGESQNQHWVRYALDPLGATTQMQTDLGHRVDCELDANGLWSAVRTAEGAEFLFARDARTQEVARRLPGPAVLTQSYDPVGRMAEQSLRHVHGAVETAKGARSWTGGAGTAGIERRYRRDSSGLVLGIDAGASKYTGYAFDPAEHLLGVLHAGGSSERYEWDGSGNLTRSALESAQGAADASLHYRPGNVLVDKDGCRHEHDAQGRLVRKIEGAGSAHELAWAYEWDALDQLRKVTRPDGRSWQYTYDPFSRRIAKECDAERIDFVWSGHVPVHEISTTDPAWTTYVYAQDSFEPIAQIHAGRTLAIIGDHLGTPQEMVDGAGRVVWRSQTTAFGEPVQDTADAAASCPYHFAGQRFDAESGLYYGRYRYYDPSCARFISQDPIRLLGGNNPYLYALNPIAWIDPWGLLCQRLAQSLPEGPGIYHIELNGQIYTGSGVNVRSRLSASDHPAAALLNDPNVRVTVYPVTLGQADGNPRMTNHILRGYEQGVMDHPSINNTPQQNGSLNQIRAAKASRTGEYANDATNNNAARGAGVPY